MSEGQIFPNQIRIGIFWTENITYPPLRPLFAEYPCREMPDRAAKPRNVRMS